MVERFALMGTLPCYLVPSSHVRLLVITMIIFLQASRSLAEPHSSVSVQFGTALMSSSQRARGLSLFLIPGWRPGQETHSVGRPPSTPRQVGSIM